MPLETIVRDEVTSAPDHELPSIAALGVRYATSCYSFANPAADIVRAREMRS